MASHLEDIEVRDLRVSDLVAKIESMQAQVDEGCRISDQMKVAKEVGRWRVASTAPKAYSTPPSHEQQIQMFMQRMASGQQQLQSMGQQVADRDAEIAELKAHVTRELDASASRLRQVEVVWESREQSALAEVAAKTKEIRHRLDDIESLKDELVKVR